MSVYFQIVDIYINDKKTTTYLYHYFMNYFIIIQLSNECSV